MNHGYKERENRGSITCSRQGLSINSTNTFRAPTLCLSTILGPGDKMGNKTDQAEDRPHGVYSTAEARHGN